MRLLYCDPDPASAALVSALRAQGLITEHALTLAGALDALAPATAPARGINPEPSRAPDVLILGLGLPLEALVQSLMSVRLSGRTLPVLYVSSPGCAAEAIAALKAGAADCLLPQPTETWVPEIATAARQALERARQDQDLQHHLIAISRAKARVETLLHEVNHRIANSLGLVNAMVRMQAACLDDPTSQKVLLETEARIAAIAGVHQHLSMTQTVGEVDAQAYLTRLIDGLRETYGAQAASFHIALAADPLDLSTDHAVSIGVAVNELLTNAMKYAYPHGSGGAIRIHLTRSEATAECGDGVLLVVEDDGQGYTPNTPAQGSGLGQKIIESMALALKGTCHAVPKDCGTRVELRFPV